MEAVAVEDLHKVYPGGVRAVDGISFRVGRGEIYTLLGPNGAGKTTTMKIIATLLKPTRGRVEIMGIDVVREPAKARRVIGYVPQDLSADDELTGMENVVLQARLYGMGRRDAEKRASQLLKMVGLGEAANRVVRSYSGGMRRRLELAMGLVNEPELLIMDEPTVGLDVQSRLGIWEYIRKLGKQEGLTILLTTHYMDEADRLSSRVAIIDRGRIVAEGSPEELKSRIGGDIITVKLSSTPSEELLDTVRGLEGVISADVVEKSLRIKTRSSTETLARLVNTLNSLADGVESISITKATLDQVFVEYTGKMFRDEEEGDFSRQMMIWRWRRRAS